MIVAAPVISQMAAALYGSGDRSQLTLDLTNLTDGNTESDREFQLRTA